MEYLVLENDEKLSDQFSRYLQNKSFTVIYRADQQGLQPLTEYFQKHDVIAFQPTQITYGQYNSLMMLLYNLIQKDLLRVKEIEVYTNGRSRDAEKELSQLWNGKGRKYLDAVLSKIPIYEVGIDYKKEINP